MICVIPDSEDGAALAAALGVFGRQARFATFAITFPVIRNRSNALSHRRLLCKHLVCVVLGFDMLLLFLLLALIMEVARQLTVIVT